jgi:hypothetical protein
MRNMPTAGELKNMSIGELRAILADDELLPLDDETNTDLILKITDLIIQKEGKSDEEREAELEAFCSGLLERHGDKIPIRVGDVVQSRARRTKNRDSGVSRTKQRFMPKRIATRVIVAVAALVMLLTVSNAVAVYAFNFNILQAIVTFTEELFSKTGASPGVTQGSLSDGASGSTASGNYGSMQSALDEFGITSPKTPNWLPDGYTFVRTEVSDIPGRVKVLGVYGNDGSEITISVVSYSQQPLTYSRNIEKSAGVPVVYNRNGIDHYIFSNLEMKVATWIDGMCDCEIQGDISEDEIKSIINSMYSED